MTTDMKNSLYKLLIIICSLFSLCAACEPDGPSEPNYISVENTTSKPFLLGYYIGEDKSFIINSDYVFNQHPECLMSIPWSSDYHIRSVPVHDGKENERTYQFIFFDGETLDKYTLSEIAERNLYDDLKVLNYEQLRKANYTVTYSGPANQKRK